MRRCTNGILFIPMVRVQDALDYALRGSRI